MTNTWKAILSVMVFAIWSTTDVAAESKQIHERLAAQMDAMRSKPDKTKKASRSLRQLHEEFSAFNRAKGKPFEASNKHLRIDNERVLIEAIAVSDGAAVQKALENLGGTHLDSVKYLASGYLPISAIPKLESIPFIKSVRPSYPMTQAGLVTSQGDGATRANTSRGLYGLDGTGVVIGTMSDSFNCLGQAATDAANDDLPTGIAIQEHPSCIGATDEGRAMMQIIHDLAPGSSQLFYTAFEGIPAFANGIRALANAGADIIVDDVVYFYEPFFQDGDIARAVDEVTVQQGVVYFSAAGNYGDQSYDSVFRADSIDNRWHDFNPAAEEDIFQSIFIPAGESITFILQWTEPYASVSGAPGASTDFDLYISDAPFTQFLAGSFDSNIGSDPIEVLNFTNPGAGALFNIVIDRFAGTGRPTLKYIYFGNLSVNEYATNSSTLFGHANAIWAEATGSVDYWKTPTYGINPPLKAPSSAKGGTPILFDTSGNPITPVVRNKPNISCVHGGNTTFFGQDIEPDGWPNFFGTSAAAPHAAALAGLIKEYKPELNPLQILQVMEGTAVDMDAAGFDFLTGAGLCEEVAALGSLENPDISLSVTPSPATLPEPGGNVSFGVSVANIGDIDVTLTALSDDAVGNLNGLGNCSIPQGLTASVGTYDCSYTLSAPGNAGDELPLTVTATANGPQNSDTEEFETSVTITDVLPTASLSASSDPVSLLEPGGISNISLQIQNTGTAEPISLTSLTDSEIGDLNGKGTCSYPVSIDPSATYQCTYPSSFTGNAGMVITRQIDATVEDDELNNLNIGGSAAVTITEYALPSATMMATVDPTELNEPGGSATISIIVENTGDAESITLTSLSASQVGDLNGEGTCSTPQPIDPGMTYECDFSSDFVGAAGTDISRQISGSAEDDDSNMVPLGDEVTVSILVSDGIFADSFESKQ